MVATNFVIHAIKILTSKQGVLIHILKHVISENLKADLAKY